MLKCKDITEQTSQYVDDQLPWHKRMSWYMHLGMCVSCRRFVKQFKLSITVAKKMAAPHLSASDSQVKAVNDKLDSEQS